MNILKVMNDRRKHKRHRVKDNSYAAISPHSKKLGKILNISKGGLVFEYLHNDEPENSDHDQTIYLSSNGCYVEDIPFKVIDDLEITNNLSFNLMKMRKQRVQFSNISPKQSFALDFYIRNNSVDSSTEPPLFLHKSTASFEPQFH